MPWSTQSPPWRGGEWDSVTGNPLIPFTLVAGAARSYPCSIRLTESSLDSGGPLSCRLSRRDHSTNGTPPVNRQLDANKNRQMDDSRSLFPRSLAPVLREALADTPGGPCLLGPRQKRGKRRSFSNSRPTARTSAWTSITIIRPPGTDPSGFVASLPDAVTLDEVQRGAGNYSPPSSAPRIRDRRPGRFVLTGLGQSVAWFPTVTESLAGRMEIAQLHPLTESEKARAPGRFLSDLLNGAIKRGVRPEAAARSAVAAGPTGRRAAIPNR